MDLDHTLILSVTNRGGPNPKWLYKPGTREGKTTGDLSILSNGLVTPSRRRLGKQDPDLRHGTDHLSLSGKVVTERVVF